MVPVQQQKAAKEFAERWQGKGYEKGESQKFWTTLLTEVFGIEHVDSFLLFEQQVKLDHTSFIDGFIPSTKVMIEQKSLGKNLAEGIKQSDGSVLNPFQQAKRYAAELPYSQRPRWIVTCNFAEFWVYDMEQPNGEPQKILLENLEKEYYRLQFLVDEGNEHLKREMEVSVKAGELVGLIYDKLLEQYIDKDSPETLRSLNILCVRLVFCLYAEDAGLFNSRTAFHDYLVKYGATDFRRALMDLFVLLDTPIAERDPYLEPDIAAFPYVNGGLFSEEKIIVPRFTDELKELILAKASDDFDWSEISPTIFGAVFESTLNPETRRSGGMHYTSIENIHKVIDPLFLNDLKTEFTQIQEIKQAGPRKQALQTFQDKLASLTFFDPACGSGNFLTETFLSLRRLENKVIQAMYGGENILTFDILIKVNIAQFYGIEINDFACTVAKTALWIAESQTLKETSAIAGRAIDFLPLKTNAYIHEGNALRVDWSEVIAPDKLNYIMGNPPFIGTKWMGKDQKADADFVLKGWKNYGVLDYVACWYRKSLDMMQGTNIRAAFVSTNSICQGEQVPVIWRPIGESGAHIDFAYPTFRWDSESNLKAHVHCVIVGFSIAQNKKAPRLYNADGTYKQCKHINGYLVDADSIYIEGRKQPLMKVPTMYLGCDFKDDGNFVMTEEEKDELLAVEPQAAQFIRPYMMGKDFISRKPRYCLWLKDANPADLKRCPKVYERVQKVQDFRLACPSPDTQRYAATPTLPVRLCYYNVDFHTDCIALPKVSSESRRYIPMELLSADVIAGCKLFLVPFATNYDFGVLTSNIHMAWMRATCGRLKSDYSYSANLVYNNFPWPTPTDEQKARIEATAQAILDARAKYPDCSLADLYDEVTMPPELRRAHQENDRAVMAAYGFSTKMTESECVAELFKMYQTLTK